MNSKNRVCLDLLQLENRLTPSFTSIFQPATDTWTLNQVQDDGNVVISLEVVPGAISIMDGSGTDTIGVISANLTINMLDNFGDNLTVDNAAGLPGNLTINLGNGDSSADVTQNLIGGDLKINAGTGAQTINLGFENPLSVLGSANINLGIGNDIVQILVNDFLVGNNVNLRGGNSFGNTGAGSTTVGGNFAMFSHQENIDTVFDPVAGMGSTIIGGGFTYRGGNGNDNVRLADSVTIGRNVSISLGNDTLGTTPQIVDMGDATIGSNVTILGGTINGRDDVLTNATTVIGGNIYINTGTLGSTGDAISLLGTIGGNSVTVITSLGNDTMTYDPVGNNLRLFVSMGLGNDSFALNTINPNNLNLNFLYVDFGFGSDIFDSMGSFTFPAILRNLP